MATPPAPSTPVTVVVTPTPVGPSVSSAEFTRNYAVGAIHAETAWAQGASGRGIAVAVIDNGVNASGPDLAGKLSASVDLDASRNQLVGADRHGTYVAGVIASNYNNQGTVGVAFDSSIVSIRADSVGGTCGADSCFKSSDLARGIDYAVANGARVINLSLGTGDGPSGAVFEAALQRAVAAGVIVAAAAGNNGSAAGHWPSGYAADQRYAGAMIGVGSLNPAGALSGFSNTAGAAATGFLFAPGEGVVTDCDGVTCRVVSGTSFAAPQVAGAMALLLQAYPNMTGRQVVDLLFRSARDIGDPGVDAVYGRGALDLSRAFSPIGALSVPTAGSGTVSDSLASNTMISAAFGDSMEASGALRTVGWDYYQRPFATNLARAYAGPRPAILSPISSQVRRRSNVELTLAGDRRLSLSAGVADAGTLATVDPFPWMPTEASRDVAVSLKQGRLGFSAWSGTASGNPFTAARHDAYSALAQSDHAVRADYALGRWLMSAEAGGGDRRSPDLLRREDGSRYLRASAERRTGRTVSTFTFGYLDEPMGPLGAYLPARTGLDLPSRTTFGAVAGTVALSDAFTLSGEAGVGRTRLSGRFLSLQDAAWSSAWRVSLEGNCAAISLMCSSLRFTAAQPLRIEDGQFVALLADAPVTYFGPVAFTERRFSAAPSGRQMDFTLSATQRTAFSGIMQLDAVASTQAGNRADAGAAYGLLASWRRGF